MSLQGAKYRRRNLGAVRLMLRFVFVAILLVLYTSTAFAKSEHSLGKSCLRKEKWDSAVCHLERAVEAHPDNAEIVRDLGKAYHHLGASDTLKAHFLDTSLVYLDRARLINANDPETYLYLGWNYERKKDYSKAMCNYKDCLGCGRLPKKIKKDVRVRRARLAVKQEVDGLVKEWEEDSTILAEAPASDSTIAVVPFVDLSGDGTVRDLAVGMVDFVIRDLKRIERLEPVERARIIELLRQLKLSDSSFMDPATAPKIGAILRVDKVISGTLDKPTERDLEIISVICVRKTQTYRSVQPVRGRLHRVLKLEDALVFAILDSLEIQVSPRDSNEITEVFTESMGAFLAYSLGLKHLDEGEYAQAAEDFEKALRLDPDFKPAKEMVKKARDLVETGCEIEEFEWRCMSILNELQEHRVKENRLKFSGRTSTGNFIPSDPNSPPEDKQKDAVAPVGTVIIRGTIR